jgi:ABC-type lipoprotein export system ATPase subunit
MCKWLCFNSKKASNAVSNCQICKCSFSTKIGTDKLSHLSDRVCNSCWRRKVQHLFQLFHLVKNSTKEERVQSPDLFVSKGNYRLLFRSLSEALQIAKCFE